MPFKPDEDPLKKQVWTRAELRAALYNFDVHHGMHPEHQFEGRAVWRWLVVDVSDASMDNCRSAANAWKEAPE